MTINISMDKDTAAFVKQVELLSGQDLMACYQCGKCSAGCPLVHHMDILPNQIIRYAQLGMKDELLNSNSIWVCVSCMTCNSRCPKGVRIAEIFEALRQIKLRKRYDHLEFDDLTDEALQSVPPIALIASMRKLTS